MNRPFPNGTRPALACAAHESLVELARFGARDHGDLHLVVLPAGRDTRTCRKIRTRAAWSSTSSCRSFCFVGFGLTIAGIVLGRRRIRERLEADIADRKTALHRLIVFLVITIGANLLIGTQPTYRAVGYMDSSAARCAT
jgi:hypothetical protein